MGIFYSTSREVYHTLFISSVHVSENAHKILHSDTLGLIMERNALGASLETTFELGRGCVQPVVAQ